MDAALKAAIELGAARLRKEFPALNACQAAIDGAGDGAPRFSARLDLRLPQSQILVSGRPAHSVEAALEAAFAEARARLTRRARLS